MNETGNYLTSDKVLQSCNRSHERRTCTGIRLLSCLMGGISGSATADAAMESRSFRTRYGKKGYSKDLRQQFLQWVD